MTALTPLEHRQLKAPREDRAAIIEPPFADVAKLVNENLSLRDQLACDLHGRSFAEISQMARAELLNEARRWTAAYRNVPSTPHDPNGLIFLAGHQPQMFHPGVWFKDFALAELARQHGATAVNLIVDNDTLSDASLRVPTGSVAEPHAMQIPFDRPDPRIPYEERRIEDRELFNSFGAHVVEQIAPLVADPLMAQYWPLVRARAEHVDNLGACLAQARHQLEGSWGLETLEVPQSRVCAGEAFQWFIAHLLARLPEFRAIHNQAIREYRQTHRVRSTSHPAPELAAEGDWLEAPFWVWTAAEPRRRRLFSRVVGNEIAISDRKSWEIRLPLSPEGHAGRAVERLLELQQSGVRIRSRALITTLWARLALGDLFLHGIGGAKYDHVTDLLMERFFGFCSPGFMVLSATLHLPIERDRATDEDARAKGGTSLRNEGRGCPGNTPFVPQGRATQSAQLVSVRAIERELRDLTYHPERHLDEPKDASAALLSEKRRWIETQQTATNAKQRCQAIRAVNAALQPKLDARRRQLLERHEQIVRRLEVQRVLAWREYAFCLYPEAILRKFLSGLLHKTV